MKRNCIQFSATTAICQLHTKPDPPQMSATSSQKGESRIGPSLQPRWFSILAQLLPEAWFYFQISAQLLLVGIMFNVNFTAFAYLRDTSLFQGQGLSTAGLCSSFAGMCYGWIILWLPPSCHLCLIQMGLQRFSLTTQTKSTLFHGPHPCFSPQFVLFIAFVRM